MCDIYSKFGLKHTGTLVPRVHGSQEFLVYKDVFLEAEGYFLVPLAP